jgi:hypothetical protein
MNQTRVNAPKQPVKKQLTWRCLSANKIQQDQRLVGTGK